LSVSLVAFLVVCALPGANHASAVVSAHPSRWVGVWGAPPEPVLNPGDFFSALRVPVVAKQSFREIVRPTLSGTAVRIRVSNRYGSSAARLTSFSVARRTQGAAIEPGSGRAVTFDGRRTVIMAPGESRISDPVTFTFGYAEDLAVSFAAPEYLGLPTNHHGFTTSYRSLPFSGDVTTDVSGHKFLLHERVNYFLTGVQAYSPGALGTVVAFGDSITDGTGSTADRHNAYPDLLADRLHRAGIKLGVVNAGIAGAAAGGCPVSSTVFGDSAASRFRRDVASWPSVRSVIVLAGGNDLRQCAWQTAEDVEGALDAVVSQAKQAGISVLLATYPPKVCWDVAAPAACPSFMGDDQRMALNQWITAQAPRVSLLLDWDRLLRDPENPHEQGKQSGSLDDIHPGPTGYALMADSIPLSLLN
jgi:lysophospholipase L1-like esterase